MRIGAPETERAHPSNRGDGAVRPWHRRVGDLQRQVVEGDVRIRPQVVQVRRDPAVMQDQRRLDEPGDPRCGLEVADVRLHGADDEGGGRVAADADDRGERLDLDRVAEQRARAVCLDVAHCARVDTCVLVRGAQDGLLGAGVWSHQAVGPAVLVDGAAPDRRVDAVTVGQSPAQRLEHDHARALAPYVPVGPRVERLAAPVRGHRTGLAEIDRECWRQDDVHTSRDRHGAVPLLDAPARLVDGDQRGGARTVDRHAGSA